MCLRLGKANNTLLTCVKCYQTSADGPQVIWNISVLFFLHNENINQNLFKKSCTGFAYSFVSDDGLCIVISLPSPLLVQCIPIMLHFALLVYAVTAAHHYGAAWANFNGCHRLQEQMQACQRKQQTEAKKGGLLCRG